MHQRDMNRQVATKTGETVAEIARRGFSPLTTLPYEREPLTIDWDQHELSRNVAVVEQRPPLTVS